MITEIIENNQDFLKKELTKHFNEKERELNLKYNMDFYSNRLILKENKGLFHMNNAWDVYFNPVNNTFKIKLIDNKNFEKVKPILEAIPEKFIVEIIKKELK